MTTKTTLPTPLFLRVPGAAALLALLLVALLPGAVTAAPGDPCAAPVDVIACENTKPGTPQAVWDVTGDGNETIQGYATQMSVDRGEPVHFKVKTDAHDYRIELYRIGYYGGDGARLVDTIQPSASLPQSQPACLTDAASGLIDCGNWGVSATWNPPADAVSGVYAARLVRTDTGGESHMLFVMRDDERRSDVVVKTADETWAAYNNYGGVSLYGHGSGGVSWWSGRGYKVSYNRPLKMREAERFSSFFSAEYPLVRWMERNGYDVSYIAGIDAARRPAELLEHKLLVSSGHDEYWSHEQRANVEAARDAGVNLAFFSGNEIFWKTRWEPSIDGTATADRTLVSYKESNATTKIDPSPLWTGTWRDGRFSPPSDGGRPENALTGTLYMVNAFRNDPIEIPARFGKARLWRNTGIDTLAPGETASLPAGLLGYEWDVDADNGHRPPGLIRLSETTRDLPRELLLNHGTAYGAGRATHSLNLYRAASGALVFGAGTVQWAWGLDGRHDNDGPDQDRRTQQATVNLLADMTVQPRSLQSNLTPATASTDGTAPTVEITGPAAGTRFSRSDVVTITGTAQDAGGVVGGVEVSVDGGETWHYAKGHEQWEYKWNVTGFGAVDLRARAADDSGNIGQADQRTLEVGCPCSLWSNAISPGTTSFADVMSYELGVKFRSDVPGYVTGVRFYKGTANTGVHLGHLWDSLGNRLGEVRFEDETATGWQTASFAKPISVLPGTTYIASYYAPKGGYALDRPFFTQPVLAPPLRALADGEDGPNAVFKSGASGFPTQTKQASNYWVDVVFDQDGTDRVGPGLLSTRPAASAESAPISADITAQFDEELDPASVNGGTFELRTAAGAPVAASVRYDAATRSAVLDPAASLDLMTTYRATLRGGEGGLRDPGGNVLKGDREWTFTTFGCPCSLWSDAALPNITSHWDTQAYELGLKFRSEVNGYVTGIRFYKGSGEHRHTLGHLWTVAGVRSARAASRTRRRRVGRPAKFSTPIAVSAGADVHRVLLRAERPLRARPAGLHDGSRTGAPASAGRRGGGRQRRLPDGSSGFPTRARTPRTTGSTSSSIRTAPTAWRRACCRPRPPQAARPRRCRATSSSASTSRSITPPSPAPTWS